MAHSLHTIKLLHGQRGTVAILFALCLQVLLGFTALAVDLAYLNLTKVELQNAADAAALAGARSLNDALSPTNWSAAADTALVVAQHNVANTARIQDATFEPGYWHLNSSFVPLPSTPVAGDHPAIRAKVAISSIQNNGPLKLFFAPILGIAESNIQAIAIAVLLAPGGGTGVSTPKLVQ